uniref:gastrula zinc finger protein XlCGF8.2DB-like n=1 Tax=Styela clava TaxID=7725 RepID=UPI001939E0ED|nr:gastrula zinc finger protein XlCGF8.2DB-like [Styela clava]
MASADVNESNSLELPNKDSTSDTIETKNCKRPETSKVKRKEPLPCPLCGKQFPFKYRLERHVKTHTAQKPGEIGDLKGFICAFCDKQFKQRALLKRHLRKHTGDRQHSCTMCGKSFFNLGQLKDHMIVKHTEERPYTCEVCGKKYGTKNQLRQHTGKWTHEKKAFSCAHCEKKFCRKSRLDRHMALHVDGKPYPCPICEKRFSCKNYLKTHINSLHYGEKPFRCDECGRCFSQLSNMKVHAEIHIIEKAQTVNPATQSKSTNPDHINGSIDHFPPPPRPIIILVPVYSPE